LQNTLKHLLDFRSYFQTEAADPIDFASRPPPNLVHDLYYLSRCTHDARFLIEQVQLRAEKLRILMRRCRWERYDVAGDLETISSGLTIWPVDSVIWELRGADVSAGNFIKPAKFIITHIYMGESYWDDASLSDEIAGELIMGCHTGSRLHIRVPDMFSFRLTDLTGRKIDDDLWVQ